MIIVERRFKDATLKFEINDQNELEALTKALVFSQPDYCKICKKETLIVWISNKAADKDGKMFPYVKRLCTVCNATSSLGQYQTGGYFWKGWEIYNKETKESTNERGEIWKDGKMISESKKDGEQQIRPEDIPF